LRGGVSFINPFSPAGRKKPVSKPKKQATLSCLFLDQKHRFRYESSFNDHFVSCEFFQVEVEGKNCKKATAFKKSFFFK
jgi:hypothetical protein